jgi:hypothetical protein
MKRPIHINPSEEFLKCLEDATEPFFHNPQVTMRNVDGVVTYISNDFDTNTLISKEPIC